MELDHWVEKGATVEMEGLRDQKHVVNLGNGIREVDRVVGNVKIALLEIVDRKETMEQMQRMEMMGSLESYLGIVCGLSSLPMLKTLFSLKYLLIIQSL